MTSTRTIGAPLGLAFPSGLGSIGFAVLLLLGLAIRVWLLPFMGSADMESYIDWGHRTATLGLAQGYTGIYFPIQWQIFGAAYQISVASGHSAYSVIKAINLFCDVLTLALILRLLRLWQLPRSWSLTYWFNPFLLVAFAQGYVDFQLSLVTIAAIWILAELRGSKLSYLASGLLIGAGALMKPQALTIVAVVAAFIVVRLARRDWDSYWVSSPSANLNRMASDVWPYLSFLAFPLVFFVAYSVYFRLAGRSLLALGHSYVIEGRYSPALTAHMLNIWYPIAYALRTDNEPIWMVDGPVVLHIVAAGLTVLSLVAVAYCVASIWATHGVYPPLFALAALATLVVPMVITGAHENHLFMGCVLATLLMALVRSFTVRVGLAVLTLVQAINLFAIYGFGLNVLTQTPWVAQIRLWYQYPVRDGAAFLAIAVFLVTLVALMRWLRRSARPFPVGIPAQGPVPSPM